VFFDLGGTLIKTVDIPEIYRRILKTHGVKAPFKTIAKAHNECEKEFDSEEMAECKEDFWVKWNSRVLKRIGINDNAEFLARKIDELWWNYAQIEVYPDVIETLFQLRSKGIKVGVVTNAFRKDYDQILQELNWTDYFDVVVGIDSCNKAKPDSMIFLYAVNKLDVCPEEAIFVGDSIKSDYEGAKKAGLKPILIDREAKSSTNVEAIRNLNEVLLYF
jgi:putative hydrolase of the HAD superfamily